jgi:hypothetical protein
MADFLDPVIDSFSPIAVDTGGLFTPASAAAIQMAQQLVNKCVELAETRTTDFDAAIAALTDDVTGWLATHAAADAVAPSITSTPPTEPSMTIADTSTALVFNNANAQATAMISDLVSDFGTFISTYFPDNSATYAAAEGYLLDAISNTTSGIVPAAIQAAILTNARDRILAEQERAEEDLYEGLSARRFRFPPGAAAGQAMKLAQSALDQIAASSRAIAIKDFELSHQTALESVRMAVTARASALQATTQYIAGIVADGYKMGHSIAGTAHQSEVAKIAAAYQAFAGRTNAAELALKAVQADASLQFEESKENQQRDMDNIEANVRAFMAQAQIIGHEVVSMLNNLRVGSSLTMGVSA